MILVWKLPAGIDIEFLRTLTGNNGGYLNPILDINGNWVVSDEEYCMPEFQQLKKEYIDIFVRLERILFEPIIKPNIF